jgi:hypothetical protein
MDHDAFELIAAQAADTPVHTNSHNHALVQNPFAWDGDDTFAEVLGAARAADVVHTNSHNHALVQNPFAWA